MRTKNFTILCSGLGIVLLFCRPVFSFDFSSRIKIGPGLSSYSDYQSRSVHGTSLDFDMDAFTLFREDASLDLRFGSRRETIFAPARHSWIGFSFRQDLEKIAERNISYQLEYDNTGFNNELVRERNFKKDDLRFDIKYSPYNFLTAYAKYGYINKAVEFDDDSFVLGKFTLGSTFLFRNMRDVLRVNADFHDKDSKTDNRDYDRKDFLISYDYSFDNLDRSGVELEIDNIKYGRSAAALTNDVMSIKAYYDDDFPKGKQTYALNLFNQVYSSNGILDHDEYIFSYNRNIHETAQNGESKSRHQFLHYDNKGAGKNDYMQWLWGYKKYTRNTGTKGYYLSNEFISRFWRNYQGSGLKEHFMEDTIGTGIRWRSFRAGTVSLGPFIGERIYFNPLARENVSENDNRYLSNPGNYFVYGFSAAGVCSPVSSMELMLSFDYRRYLDYKSLAGSAESEVLGFSLYLTQSINESLRIINKMDYGRNINDAGAASSEAGAFVYSLSAEYLFNAKFTEGRKKR